MTPMRKRDCPRTPRMFDTIKCGSNTSGLRASVHRRFLAAQRLRVFSCLRQNVNESRRRSSEFTAAVLKTQPAPVCLRSVRRYGKRNKCKQVPVRARAAKSPRWRYFQFYILHQLSGIAYRLLRPPTVAENSETGYSDTQILIIEVENIS